MSGGTVTVIDDIAPQNDGNFPVTCGELIQGGAAALPTIAARDAIPSGRRREGQRAVVTSGFAYPVLYELKGGIGNENWEAIAVGNHTVETQDAITINVDPAAAAPNLGLIFDASMAVTVQNMTQALSVLPPFHPYVATVALADGVHTPALGPYPLGNFDRFRFGSNDASDNINGWGAIRWTSASGMVNDPAAPTSLVVASATSSSELEMTAAPYADNLHRGKELYHPASGQFKKIASHVGTTWTFAGRYSPIPGATDTLDVRIGAAEIDLANHSTPFAMRSRATDAVPVSGRGFSAVFEALEISHPTALQIYMIGLGISFRQVRMLRAYLRIDSGYVEIGNLTIDGDGTGGASLGLLAVSGGGIRSDNSNDSTLLRDSASRGIRVTDNSNGQPSAFTGFKMRIDDCATNPLYVAGTQSNMTINTSEFRGTGNGSPIQVLAGSRCEFDASEAAGDAENIANQGFEVGDGFDVVAQTPASIALLPDLSYRHPRYGSFLVSVD